MSAAAMLLRQSPSGEEYAGTVGDVLTCQGGSFWKAESLSLAIASSPVFVERYLVAASNDIKTAIKLAWATNLTATWFILPPGAWEWPSGSALTAADGLRPSLVMQGQYTTIFFDAHGAPTGQIIFFFSAVIGEMRDQTWRDITFEHRNPITGFASFSHDYEQPIRCKFINCTWTCTPDPAIIVGKGQWGIALLGGNDNIIRDSQVTASQLAMSGAGRSCLNAICDNIQAHDCNDLVISIVGDGAANTLVNVSIRNIQCFNSRGNGVVFAGSDGGVNPVGVVRNVVVDGVMFAGTHNDNIPRAPVAVTFDPGLVTESIQISHVMSQQTDPLNSNRGILISSGAQTSWDGLVLSDIDIGVMSTTLANQVDAIFISVNLLSGLRMTNIRCKGNRGIFIDNVDHILANNVYLDNGTFSINADGRDIDSVLIDNCSLTSAVVLKAGLAFGSSAAHNFTQVRIADSILAGTSFGLQTVLTGGTMDMTISDLKLSPANSLQTETLAGIVTASDCLGVF